MTDQFDVSPTDWIDVPNWTQFQHYHDRHPLWIKVYTRLLHNPKYLALSMASRGLLLQIWLRYADEGGPFVVQRLNNGPTKSRRFYQLKSLNDAGFILLTASEPLDQRREELREESPQTPLVEKSKPDRVRELSVRAFDIATEWEGDLDSNVFAERLDDLERELKARLTSSQREQLWDEALRHERGRL